MPIEPRERRGAEAAHDSRPIAEQNFQQEILFAFPGARSLGCRLVTESIRSGPTMAKHLISPWTSQAIRRWQLAVIAILPFVSAGCGSGDSPSAQSMDPTHADLHGVAFDPATSDQFSGTALSGLTNDVVMFTFITGGSDYDIPVEITQVTVEVDGKNLPCWHFPLEGLLAKDTSGAIRIIGGTVVIGGENGGGGVTVLQVFDREPQTLLPAPPIADGMAFEPYPRQPGDETVITLHATAPTGATGCFLLRHSSPGVVGVVVSTQNRDQWILPGAAMPFQARYLLSSDRTINHGGYRLSSAPGG